MNILYSIHKANPARNIFFSWSSLWEQHSIDTFQNISKNPNQPSYKTLVYIPGNMKIYEYSLVLLNTFHLVFEEQEIVKVSLWMNGKQSKAFCCQVERKKVFKFHILGATSQNMKNNNKIVPHPFSFNFFPFLHTALIPRSMFFLLCF